MPLLRTFLDVTWGLRRCGQQTRTIHRRPAIHNLRRLDATLPAWSVASRLCATNLTPALG